MAAPRRVLLIALCLSASALCLVRGGDRADPEDADPDKVRIWSKFGKE